MKILVTNDDGVFAPGLLALAIGLAKEHDVTVAAPDSERSGMGHAFTIHMPLRAREVELSGFSGKAFAISGTPVDCVKLGAYNLCDSRPDMVVSGINFGPNLGSDVLYSGTASAALEGGILGIPSIAVSLASYSFCHFDTAARFALEMAAYLCDHPLPDTCVLNVNVPNLPYDDVKGIRLCPLSRQEYNNKYVEGVDPRGVSYYWLPSDRYDNPKNGENTDDGCIKAGYVSVTPITYMLTAERAFAGMRSHPIFNK